MKEVTKTIYIAEDGKEFFKEDDCKKYEYMLSNIKFFCIYCNPELTETGSFTSKIFIAVLSERYYHKEIVTEWAYRKFKGCLGPGVQGCWWLPTFELYDSDKQEFDNSKKEKQGFGHLNISQVFLSPKPVEGFPENFNYVKEWFNN